jgi:gas vesicle protein
MPEQAPNPKNRSPKAGKKASSSPQYLIKAFRSNRIVNDNEKPDLTVSSNPKNRSWFVFGGADADKGLFSAFIEHPTGAAEQPWRYERLEVYADGSVLTFVMPTVSSEKIGKEDKIFVEKAAHKRSAAAVLTIRCHMLVLNGGQNDGDQGRFQISICRKSDGAVQLCGGILGDKTWDKPIDLAQFGGELSDSQPYKHALAGGTPGPLLKFASISDFGSYDKLEIQLGRNHGKLPTFSLTYTPDVPRDPFRLNSDTPPCLNPPVPLPSGRMYRITQRASDEWLLRTTDDQWLVEFECGGLKDLVDRWNSSRTEYIDALNTARSVNRITLLPSVDVRDKQEHNLRLWLLITRTIGFRTPYWVELKDLCLAHAALTPAQELYTALTVNLVPARNRSAAPKPADNRGASPSRTYCATIGPAVDAPNGSFAFSATLHNSLDDPKGKPLCKDSPSDQKVQVRIGSLDLAFGAVKEDMQSSFQLLNLSDTSTRVPRMWAKMTLPIESIAPGGQDGLPSSEYAPENYQEADSVAEECMERRFNGSAPVVIPIPLTGGESGSYMLTVQESNTEVYSQTVFLQLDYVPPGNQETANIATANGAAADKGKADKGAVSLSAAATTASDNAAPERPRVIVIDSDPFLVAEVQYSKLQPRTDSSTVALWSTGELGGAAWQLKSDSEPFSLILPPQGIGEEMPKTTELDDKDKDPLKALDFRFSPAARQELQASYTPQNFTEAPWNLRRILGYPGQRDAGAGVVQLNYELLYGLSCSADTPLIRLADILSLIGRIPGRVPRTTIPPDAGAPKDADALYGKKRWDWSLYAELYSKRVALLEPRASGNNYGKTVGVAGASAATEVFTLSNAVHCAFRGNADLYYSLDPKEIAKAKADDETFPIPHPDTALKGGVSWPFESPRLFHATVRNPKSSSAVVSGLALSPLGGTGTVEAGFDKDLSTITSVTEIGRSSKISVARLGRISVFHNLARYVIEYERDTSVSPQFNGAQTPFKNRPVLRKVREFVEILDPIGTLSNSAQPFPGGGCVKSIEFKKPIIPVKGAWSTNVGKTGWKIPLWYQPDSVIYPGNNYAYTRPEVVFNLAGADAADVECAILSADKLFFYTDTDEKADSDPHNWPIVWGVDFHPIPLPAPNPAFPSNSANEIPAYDSPTPFGLALFTHQLDVGHGRVNLVNGRSAQAIGSNLASVTLQRAPLNVPQLQKDIQGVHDLVRNDLFTAIRTDVSKVSGIADNICNQAKALAAPLEAQVDDLVKKVGDKETELLHRFVDQVAQEIKLVDDELKAQLHAQSELQGKTIDQAKATIHQIVVTEANAFRDRLNSLPVSANALQQFFARVCETLDNAKDDLARRKSDLLTALQGLQVTASNSAAEIEKYVSDVKEKLGAPIERINSLLTQVHTQVQSRAEPWMPGASLVWHKWEDDIVANIASAQTIFTKADTMLAAANAGADDQVNTARGDVGAAINAAKSSVSAISFPAVFLGDYAKTAKLEAQELQNYIESLPGTIAGNIDRWVTDAAQQANITVINGEKEIDTLVDAIAQGVLTLFDVTGALKPTLDKIKGYATTVADNLKNIVKNVADQVCKAATALQNAVATVAASQLESLRRTVEDALGRLAESIAHALSTDIALPSGISVPALLNRAFGSAPSIPNLGFSLPNAAYFFDQLSPKVDLTPVLTKVKDLIPNLSPLSTLVPSFALSDRALPVPNLPNFDLNSIFPDFAGLKLDNLFPSLKMPSGSNDAVKITHGLDQASRTAWVQADIDLKTDTATIFSVGPMALQIVTPRFTAQVRVEAGANGQASKQASGAITGDWQLIIGGSPMITLSATSLSYDKDGKLHVDVSPDRVRLSAALAFLEQVIALYSSPDSGFGIFPSLTGIETRLSLPIPDTSLGTSGITNLTFNFLFGLSWASGFQLYAGFGLASPDAPFNISVFILGGCGHLVANAYYTPGKSLTCKIDMALAASASLSIALGPIKGSVHINLGMRFVFNSGQGDLSLGIFLLIGGEVSILSIVSANILLRLDATYENGSFTGRGIFSISIKICWCFTLNVHEEVTCHLGSGQGIAYNEPLPFPWEERSDSYFALSPESISSVPPPSEMSKYDDYAQKYLQLIS